MSKIDEFESVFRAAVKTRFAAQPVALRRLLAVTDLAAEMREDFSRDVGQRLGTFHGELEWEHACVRDLGTVEGLLERVEEARPDMICTYRNLGTQAWQYPFSLGVHLDVLAQATTTPILVMPNPHSGQPPESRPINRVMAVTDHLTGDDQLVSWALSLAAPDGELLLSNIEDEDQLERLFAVIDKIPAIDSDTAREQITRRLLKEPQDYISSVEVALRTSHPSVKIEAIVRIGHELQSYRELIRERDVDLLVLHTKDETQLAMHALAYALAIELRDIPILML